MTNPTPAGPAAPDPSTAPTGYRPHLDGLRALAVVAVICFHLGYSWIPGGFVGVDVFFVLSGFLITGLLLDELADRSTIRLRRFYARRARRLLPASIAVLAVVMVTGTTVLDRVQQASLGWDTTWAALYSANWRFAYDGGEYFAPGDIPSPLVHYWSLAVEEQFYLVWPVLLLGLWHLARRLRGDKALGVVTVAVGALTAASLTASLVLVDSPAGYYGTHTRAYQLLAGALLATVLRWRTVRLPDTGPVRAGAALAAVGAFGGLGFLAHTIPDATGYPGTRALWVTIASLVLIAAVDLVPSGPAARVVGVRPAAAVGRLSYSLYIWHWPVIVLLPPLVERWAWDPTWTEPVRLALVTVVFALVSYLLVERPIRFRLVPSARPAAVIGFGLAASALVGAIAYPVLQPHDDFDRKVIGAADDRPDEPCPYEVTSWPTDADDADPCVLREGASGGTVIAVVGDSHAQAWLPAIETLAEDDDATIVVATREGCPPVDLTPYIRSETNQINVQEDCTAWRREVYPEVVEQFDPDVVFVAQRSHVRSYDVDGERVPARRPGHLETWTEGWEWTLDTLTSGSGVLVLSTILPTMPWDVPACLAEAGLDEGCDSTMARDRWVDQYNDVIRGFAGRADGRVRVIDPVPFVCPDETCEAMIGGEVVRRDDNHLTASFAESQATALGDAFERLDVTL